MIKCEYASYLTPNHRITKEGDNMKKLLAMMLVLMMVLGLASTAFADMDRLP